MKNIEKIIIVVIIATTSSTTTTIIIIIIKINFTNIIVTMISSP